jgi:hypothetical protein
VACHNSSRFYIFETLPPPDIPRAGRCKHIPVRSDAAVHGRIRRLAEHSETGKKPINQVEAFGIWPGSMTTAPQISSLKALLV